MPDNNRPYVIGEAAGPESPRLPHPIPAFASLFSGAALVLSVWLDLPLIWMLLASGVFAVAAVATRYSALSSERRSDMASRIRCGLLAGFVATTAYDLWRLLLVRVAGFPIHPFDTFRMFGLSIAGSDSSLTVAYSAGTLYHLLNGIMFAVAYLLLFAQPRLLTAVMWALGLELAMFTVYPGWLDLEAVMMEFTVMSLSGHVVYGTVLGLLGHRLLSGDRG